LILAWRRIIRTIVQGGEWLPVNKSWRIMATGQLRINKVNQALGHLGENRFFILMLMILPLS
jgi:hypothetical protein